MRQVTVPSVTKPIPPVTLYDRSPEPQVARRYVERYLERGRPKLQRSRLEERVFLSMTGAPLVALDDDGDALVPQEDVW